MWQRIFRSVIAAAVFVSLTADLTAQDKKKPGDPNAIDTSKIKAGKYNGKLASTPSAGGALSLEVMVPSVSGGKVVVDLPVASEPIVRMMILAAEYDDKGKLKQRTPAELKKLRGTNPKLPGYESKLEDLQPGMTVQVTFGRAVPPKSADKEKEPTAKPNTNEVTMIVVTNPETGDGLPGQPPKRKK